MQKREPVIIAPDYTDDEIYEWMCGKIRAINDLKQAADYKERLSKETGISGARYYHSGKRAALNVSRVIANY